MKPKLSYGDQLDWVWSVVKTRQDNNLINCISMFYAEIETELSGPI